jgi:phytoene dehydrogenase-like protein
MEKVWEGKTVLPSALDLHTAKDWLTSLGQTYPTQTTVWDPLCQFLLGTSLSHTRAGNFTTMLTRVFFQSRHHSPRITPVPQLSTLLVKSLTEQLEQQGATIHRIPAIELLQVGAEHITGVCTSNGTRYTADSYIATVHPTTLSSFLPERLLARYSSFHQMSQATFTPRMIFNAISGHTINKPRLILHDGRFSWTLCRPTHTSKGRATLLSCVSTGDTDFLSETDQQIKACAIETLHNAFPDQTFLNPELLHRYHIVRQPLGFVPDMPGTEPSRPSNQTPIRNFLLAGSWTDTGASTEMESAIASGDMCAQTMINQLYKRH